MFSFILKIVGSALHFYVVWRLASVPAIHRRIGPMRWTVLGLLVWFVYIFGLSLRRESDGLGWLLAQFSLNWLAVVFLITLCLLPVDIATGFGLWVRRGARRLRGIAAAVGLLIVGFALFQGLRAPIIVDYQVSAPELPEALDGTRVVVLTDLHLGNQRGNDWMSARVEQVRALKPDLVVMVGDQVDSELRDPQELPAVLRRLEAPLGVWAVTGNHDYHGDLGATVGLFESGGVRWLRNAAERVAPGLYLTGIDDLGRSMRRADGSAERAVSTVLEHAPAQGFNIFLSHTPTAVERAAQSGADLMLSGHTHGGQIWPFNFLVQRAFPRYIGRHDVDDMTLIVSRGAGSWGPRMRLWHPGEILNVMLRSK